MNPPPVIVIFYPPKEPEFGDIEITFKMTLAFQDPEAYPLIGSTTIKRCVPAGTSGNVNTNSVDDLDVKVFTMATSPINT